MEFHEILKDIMQEKNMSVADVARVCGLTDSTVRSIIDRQQKKIALNVAFKISDGLNVSLHRLNGMPETTEIKRTPLLSSEALKIATDYDTKLDSWGKKQICDVVANESARCIAALQETEQPQQESDSDLDETATIEKIIYVNPAAAGVPLYAEDDFERIELPAHLVPHGADFGIRISGDSMEPEIPNGSIVWVRKTQEIENGQVGVFMIDSSAVCKRFYQEGDTIQLRSDNPAYGPVEISEFSRIGTVGIVIGMMQE